MIAQYLFAASTKIKGNIAAADRHLEFIAGKALAVSCEPNLVVQAPAPKPGVSNAQAQADPDTDALSLRP